MLYSHTKYAHPTEALKKTQNIVLLLAFMISLGLFGSFAALLCAKYNPIASANRFKMIFVDAYAGVANPNPKERFIYLFLICTLPLISFISVKLAMPLMPRKKIYLYSLQIFSLVVISFIAGFAIYIFKSSLYLTYLDLKTMTNWRLLLLAIASSVYFWMYLQKKSAAKSTILQSYGIFVLVTVLVLIPSLAFRLISLYTQNRDYLYGPPHFGAVYYSVTQVVGGKTLLVNFPAQYGMYSEILNPLFKIIGLSVFKFIALMTLLVVIGMVSLFVTMRKALHSPLLTIFCITCLSCYITYAFYGYNLIFVGRKLLEPILADPYYQYFPIRFVFPAVSVYLFASFLQKKNSSLSISALSIFSTLAVLWNLDSGVPVLGAFLAYIGSYIVFPSLRINRIRAIKLLCLALSTVMIFLMLFMIYITWKANGRAVHFSWIYKYQFIFAQAGLGKTNFPLSLDPWQIIFSIYILGITTAIFMWNCGRRSFTSDLVFYLSVLGIGLFTYYEYRALPICLIPSSWPAVMIAFIFCDSIFRSIQLKTLPRFFSIICYPVILFSMILLITLIHFLPVIYHYELKNWQAVRTKQENFITANLQFMRAHLGNEKQVVILAAEQAIYYGELNVASAIDGPGIFEILLKSDVAYAEKQLNESKAKIVFYQLDDHKYHPDYVVPLDTTFLKNYNVEAVSPYGMEYLVRKNN